MKPSGYYSHVFGPVHVSCDWNRWTVGVGIGRVYEYGSGCFIGRFAWVAVGPFTLTLT